MKRLPHEYVDLVFADPPYNIGVDYGKRKMTEITPDCPEFMEFMKWFTKESRARANKFYTHASTCPNCQQAVIEMKGQMDLKIIQTSDAEFIEMMKSFTV